MAIKDKTSYDAKSGLYATEQKITPSVTGVGSSASIQAPRVTNDVTFYDEGGGSRSGGNSGNGGNQTPPSVPPVVQPNAGGANEPEIDPSSVYLDEIQKAASEKNYKTLLQSDIAAYNLKMGTQKHLDNMLAAQGLGTQGYGTSAHVGVENAAQNLYAQNLENYNQREADALSEAQERQRQEEEQAIAEAKSEATESDNQLVTFLTYSDGSEESINGYMEKYGYTLKDGVWVNKETGEPASAYIQAAVQSAKENGGTGQPSYGISTETATSNASAFLSAYGVGKDASGNVVGYSIDDLYGLQVSAMDDTATKALKDVVYNELEWLKNHIGQYQDGTLFKLERGNGRHEAYLILYSGGKFYLVSTSDDEQEGGQVSTRYNEYNGPKETFRGK